MVTVCVGLMGPGARETKMGKALMGMLNRAVRNMSEEELRSNLTDVRDRLNEALSIRETPTVEAGNSVVLPSGNTLSVFRVDGDFDSDDIAAIAQGE